MGILPMSGHFPDHGRDPAFAGGYGGQAARATSEPFRNQPPNKKCACRELNNRQNSVDHGGPER